MRCHDGEQAVLVCDAKGFERGYGLCRKRNSMPEHLHEWDGGRVKNPCEHNRRCCGANGRPPRRFHLNLSFFSRDQLFERTTRIRSVVIETSSPAPGQETL